MSQLTSPISLTLTEDQIEAVRSHSGLAALETQAVVQKDDIRTVLKFINSFHMGKAVPIGVYDAFHRLKSVVPCAVFEMIGTDVMASAFARRAEKAPEVPEALKVGDWVEVTRPHPRIGNRGDVCLVVGMDEEDDSGKFVLIRRRNGKVSGGWYHARFRKVEAPSWASQMTPPKPKRQPIAVPGSIKEGDLVVLTEKDGSFASGSFGVALRDGDRNLTFIAVRFNGSFKLWTFSKVSKAVWTTEKLWKLDAGEAVVLYRALRDAAGCRSNAFSKGGEELLSRASRAYGNLNILNLTKDEVRVAEGILKNRTRADEIRAGNAHQQAELHLYHRLVAFAIEAGVI